MVEIKRTRTVEAKEADESTANHRLLYSKSKVYVYPTPYARDNIPGFMALVKKVRQQGYKPLQWAYTGPLRRVSSRSIFWHGFPRVC
jgi:TBC1 domain family member 15